MLQVKRVKSANLIIMKKLLLILLCLPLLTLAQKTYVPDDNFEQVLINFGYDNVLDDSVITANIDTVTSIDLLVASDLTGIEDFIALTNLFCQGNQGNQLTTLNVSQNTALTSLYIAGHQLISLDLSNNTALTQLQCSNNQLTTLDVSNNTALTFLICGFNQLTSLDVSANTNLVTLLCSSNTLTSLDLRNGNNINFSNTNGIPWAFCVADSPNLTCINVDDDAWSSVNWTVANGNIDPQHYFSTNCSATAIEEHTTNKELLKVTDLLGRETKQTNHPLFYIFDDGTVEKRIVIE